MEGAGVVGGERSEEARGHDVVLRRRTAARDERPRERRAGHECEHRNAERGAAVAPQARHVTPFPRRPTPGQANTASTSTAPEKSAGSDRPSRVTTGIRALRATWRRVTWNGDS